MLRVVIGDNDRLDRLTLRGILSQTKDLILEGEAEDETRLASLVESTMPQAVFLNVDMPGLNLKNIIRLIEGVNHRTFIILMSSAVAFSKEAMEVFAFHRLYKPLDLKNTVNTIDRMKNILSSYNNPGLPPTAGHHTKSGIPTPQTLVIHVEDDLFFIKVNDIAMINRNGRKTEIHTDNNIFKVNEPLEKIESRLGGNFFRSHKGYIVNSDKINGLTLWGNKTYLIRLNNTKATALMTFERFKLYRQLYCIE